MSETLIRFSIAVLLIAALLFFSVAFGSAQVYFAVPSFRVEIIVFLSVSTLAFYFYLLKKIAHNPEDFIGAFLLTLVLRFLLFAGLMFVIILMNKPGATANALFFMTTYVILTVVEVVFLYQKVTSAKTSK
jgi:ABC-type multidrug transport system permease subunit